MVASVDNIWAPLGWNPRMLKDFNFCRMEVHTFETHEPENVARFPNGLPRWCDPCAARHKAVVGACVCQCVTRGLAVARRDL